MSEHSEDFFKPVQASIPEVSTESKSKDTGVEKNPRIPDRVLVPRKDSRPRETLQVAQAPLPHETSHQPAVADQRDPYQMSPEEVRAFLASLGVKERISLEPESEEDTQPENETDSEEPKPATDEVMLDLLKKLKVRQIIPLVDSTSTSDKAE
jgi:hypothetical protein